MSTRYPSSPDDELDVVADADVLGDRQVETRKQIRERILQRQRDGEAADAEGRQHRRDIEAQPLQDDEQSENHDDDAHEVFGERRRRQRGIDRRPVRADQLDEHFRGQERQRRRGDDVQPFVDRDRDLLPEESRSSATM